MCQKESEVKTKACTAAWYRDVTMSQRNLPQCNTHVRRKHLGVCVQCRLCSRRSFQSDDIQKHLRDVHCDSENQWFEPTPLLEGDIIEVSSDTLEANIALVKQEPVTPIEDEEDDEEED